MKPFVRHCLLLPFASLLLYAQDNPDRVVAVVNGEKITAAQLDSATKMQLEAIQEQVRKLKQTALNKMIDNLLLEQAARVDGLSIEEYLEKNVEQVAVGQDEVEDAYRKSKDNFPGVLAPEAKYRIRRTLEDNRRADALRALLQKLRQQALVTNYLWQQQAVGLTAATKQGPATGASEPSVTIVEFSDFECPYCRDAQPLLKRILDRWPTQVRLVFKHFPLDRHPNAFGCAAASVCAGRQQRFWSFHDRLFDANPDLSRSGVIAVAASLGMDMAEFEQCLGSTSTSEVIRNDMQLGRAVGVTGTPAFFVNGQAVSGAAELEGTIQQLFSRGAQTK